MRSADNDWSEAEIELAAKLWAAGLTVSNIADELTRTFRITRSRGAVSGLMHRHRTRFAPRGRPASRPSAIGSGQSGRAKAPAAKPSAFVHAGNIHGKKESRAHDPVFVAPRPSVADGIVYDAASLHLPLAELKPGQCKWPVNDAAPGEQHLFCGQKARPGGHYCAHHATRAFSASRAEGAPEGRRIGADARSGLRALPEREEAA